MIKNKTKLANVRTELITVMLKAAERCPYDLYVIEGMRTLERQKKLLGQKATTTLNSRHLTGHAVDIAPMLDGEISWAWPVYHEIAPIIKQTAKELDIDIRWGGDWKKFKDGPHWELSWEKYPIMER